MAEIKTGILGGISGTIGNVVGAIWRGKSIIRTKPRKSKTKATESQLKQRSKFKLVSNFLQPLNFFLGRYFGVAQEFKSKANLALAYHLKEAVDETDNGIAIKLDKVVLSKGVLPSVVMETATIENGLLILAWTTPEKISLGKGTDLLTVVVYGKNTNLTVSFHRVVARNANGFSVKLPPELAEDDCFVWCFLTDELDKESSTSMFISRLNIS